VFLEFTDVWDVWQNCSKGQAPRLICSCGSFLILALPPGGKGRRSSTASIASAPTFLTDRATGWLKGELQPPEKAHFYLKPELYVPRTLALIRKGTS
jgi:hypothetical protein